MYRQENNVNSVEELNQQELENAGTNTILQAYEQIITDEREDNQEAQQSKTWAQMAEEEEPIVSDSSGNSDSSGEDSTASSDDEVANINAVDRAAQFQCNISPPRTPSVVPETQDTDTPEGFQLVVSQSQLRRNRKLQKQREAVEAAKVNPKHLRSRGPVDFT